MTQVLRHLCNKFQNISSSWVLWGRKEAPSFFHSSSPALWLLKFWFYLFFFKLQPIRTGNSAWILIPFWFFFLSCLVVLEEIRAEFASLPFSLEFLTSAKQKKTLGRLFLGWNCAISDLTLRGVPGNVKKNPNSLFPERKFILGLLPLTCLTCRAAGAEFWGKILKNLIYSLPSPTEIFQDFSHQRNIPKPKQPNLQGGFIFVVFFNEWSFKTNQMWVESTSLS